STSGSGEIKITFTLTLSRCTATFRIRAADRWRGINLCANQPQASCARNQLIARYLPLLARNVAVYRERGPDGPMRSSTPCAAGGCGGFRPFPTQRLWQTQGCGGISRMILWFPTDSE